jgi:hypothetical protein
MRRFKRQRAGYVCLIECRDGLQQCRIDNLSVRGARLAELPEPLSAGQTLNLSWTSRKLWRSGRVVWAKGKEAGIQFVGPPPN